MKLVRKNYESQAEKRKDFILGIGIWFILNLFFFAVLVSLPLLSKENDLISQIYTLISPLLNLLLFFANIGLAVYFAFTRYWIALGMVAIYAFLLALGLILGIIASVVCFVAILATGGY